jgi:hypothetical protein
MRPAQAPVVECGPQRLAVDAKPAGSLGRADLAGQAHRGRRLGSFGPQPCGRGVLGVAHRSRSGQAPAVERGPQRRVGDAQLGGGGGDPDRRGQLVGHGRGGPVDQVAGGPALARPPLGCCGCANRGQVDPGRLGVPCRQGPCGGGLPGGDAGCSFGSGQAAGDRVLVAGCHGHRQAGRSHPAGGA